MPEDIIIAGEQRFCFLLAVYGYIAEEYISLDANRYCFLKSANNRTFNLAMLPPISISTATLIENILLGSTVAWKDK